MKLVSTSIAIAAAPERVWRILTDLPAYPEWNPFMRSVSGSVARGATLTVRIQPPGGKAMTFRPVVLAVTENRELRWRGRLVLPGLFDGEHSFAISPTQDGTSLAHGEKFSGLIVRLMGPAIFEQTRRGFVAMNEALKVRAEA